ncbi:hypothetical protein B0H16DRAFT_1476048 [Mycena metata]|uniref:Uncharacterized protein n=1 Tax=Mycena metata TaxID=1033252 RepID=A0AAD7HCK9_9AGAR|nr:hypothetical protein B0H16DRAFT_1476048 [Mycena metata]
MVASYCSRGSWSGCVVSSYAFGYPDHAPTLRREGHRLSPDSIHAINWDSGPHGRHSGAEPTQYDAQTNGAVKLDLSRNRLTNCASPKQCRGSETDDPGRLCVESHLAPKDVSEDQDNQSGQKSRRRSPLVHRYQADTATRIEVTALGSGWSCVCRHDRGTQSPNGQVGRETGQGGSMAFIIGSGWPGRILDAEVPAQHCSNFARGGRSYLYLMRDSDEPSSAGHALFGLLPSSARVRPTLLEEGKMDYSGRSSRATIEPRIAPKHPKAIVRLGGVAVAGAAPRLRHWLVIFIWARFCLPCSSSSGGPSCPFTQRRTGIPTPNLRVFGVMVAVFAVIGVDIMMGILARGEFTSALAVALKTLTVAKHPDLAITDDSASGAATLKKDNYDNTILGGRDSRTPSPESKQLIQVILGQEMEDEIVLPPNVRSADNEIGFGTVEELGHEGLDTKMRGIDWRRQ